MYIALYRKKRPRNFFDVVGQDAIVRTILNQLETARVSHAYLFTGSRGTGKTTMAKILSRAVNCLQPVQNEPCNECAVCLSILQNVSVDVIEIDAASNNGVDNIRDIREEVKYPPTMAKQKVYIIDEVHMLSTGAFNALLKTLEEPPPHVMFILATTDPHKIPATILSRCQRFDFKRITATDIEATLTSYIDDDNYPYEAKAIKLISLLAEGSMRDGVSILDQCLSFFAGETITEALVRDMLGAVNTDTLFLFTDYLHGANQTALLQLIQTMVDDGKDITQFATDIIRHLRNLLVSLVTTDDSLALDYTDEHIQNLASQGKAIDKEILLYYIEVFSEMQGQMRYANTTRILLELAVFKIMSGPKVIAPLLQTQPVAPANNQQALMDKLYQKILAQDKAIEALAKGHGINPGHENTAKPAEIQPKTAKPRPIPSEYNQIVSEWNQVKVAWGTAHMKFLIKTTMEYINDTLFLICENTVILTALKSKESIILSKLADKYNKDLVISMITATEYKEKYAVNEVSDLDELESWINQ